MVAFDLKIANDNEGLAKLATHFISQSIKDGLKNKDRVQIALSGGSTPSNSYTLLREEPLQWNLVDVLLGDERWVSPDDKLSNALMLRRTLLATGPASNACFYPVPTTECETPEESAKEFSRIISNVCLGDPPVLDLVLLGLGEDGHTASLFPGTDALTVMDSFATVGRGKDQERITLTAGVLSAASKVIFLVSGKSKQIALKRLLDPEEPYTRTPAKLIRPNSEVLILADANAADF